MILQLNMALSKKDILNIHEYLVIKNNKIFFLDYQNMVIGIKSVYQITNDVSWPFCYMSTISSFISLKKKIHGNH